MKNMLIVLFLVTAVACTKKPKANAELDEFVHYVDSLENVVNEFHATNDTTYIDTPIDPTDPDFTRTDTIVTSNAKVNYFTGRYALGVNLNCLASSKEKYEQKHQAIDKTKLDDSQRKEMEAREETFARITTEYSS